MAASRTNSALSGHMSLYLSSRAAGMVSLTPPGNSSTASPRRISLAAFLPLTGTAPNFSKKFVWLAGAPPSPPHDEGSAPARALPHTRPRLNNGHRPSICPLRPEEGQGCGLPACTTTPAPSRWHLGMFSAGRRSQRTLLVLLLCLPRGGSVSTIPRRLKFAMVSWRRTKASKRCAGDQLARKRRRVNEPHREDHRVLPVTVVA